MSEQSGVACAVLGLILHLLPRGLRSATHPTERYIFLSKTNLSQLCKGKWVVIINFAETPAMTLERQSRFLKTLSDTWNKKKLKNRSFSRPIHDCAFARIEENTVRNNGGQGINVRQSAAADIFSNTVMGNTQRGIQVGEAASADIADNTIIGNMSDGIRVRMTAHISDVRRPQLHPAQSDRGKFGTGNILSDELND
jgi:parallel beta-helix repeat protein